MCCEKLIIAILLRNLLLAFEKVFYCLPTVSNLRIAREGRFFERFVIVFAKQTVFSQRKFVAGHQLSRTNDAMEAVDMVNTVSDTHYVIHTFERLITFCTFRTE